jgi:hypothetical protein
MSSEIELTMESSTTLYYTLDFVLGTEREVKTFKVVCHCRLYSCMVLRQLTTTGGKVSKFQAKNGSRGC